MKNIFHFLYNIALSYSKIPIEYRVKYLGVEQNRLRTKQNIWE